MSVGDYPRVRLAHVHSETSLELVVFSSTTTRYSLHPLPVRRPASGVVEDVVSCGSCGTTVKIRVFSPRLRWQLKLCWFSVFLIGAW